MYPALDGLIERCHPIRCQDHDALEVFQLSQEDGDEGVVLQVSMPTSFEKDVRFIEEQDCLPTGDEVQDLCERLLEASRVKPKITSSYL